jgi:glycosyltransferase involved in cell wall biosynthesis
VSELLWEILICTVPWRHDRLLALLAELDCQHRPGMGARLYRDPGTMPIAAKRQALLEASAAAYVCFLDDDDWISPRYVPVILAAIQEGPDYVGFCVRYLVYGTDQCIPVSHSIRHPGWLQDNTGICRDISHLNPIRREIAMAGSFEGGYSEDSRWAAGVRASGLIRSEAWIPEPLYEYRFSTTDNSGSGRTGLADDTARPLPAYPWLAVTDACVPAGAP